MKTANHPMPRASDRAVGRLEELDQDPPAFRFLDSDSPVVDVLPIEEITVDAPGVEPILVVDVVDDGFGEIGFVEDTYFTIA